jgi:hypothetical protein
VRSCVFSETSSMKIQSVPFTLSLTTAAVRGVPTKADCLCDASRDFKLRSRRKWDLRSSGILRTVIPYWRFGTIYTSHLQWSTSPRRKTGTNQPKSLLRTERCAKHRSTSLGLFRHFCFWHAITKYFNNLKFWGYARPTNLSYQN